VLHLLATRNGMRPPRAKIRVFEYQLVRRYDSDDWQWLCDSTAIDDCGYFISKWITEVEFINYLELGLFPLIEWDANGMMCPPIKHHLY
jgi:hypothetical protein